jgi:hypothetical protein
VRSTQGDICCWVWIVNPQLLASDVSRHLVSLGNKALPDHHLLVDNSPLVNDRLLLQYEADNLSGLTRSEFTSDGPRRIRAHPAAASAWTVVSLCDELLASQVTSTVPY